MNCIKISSEKEELDLLAVGKLINRVKTIAKKYRELTGRPLGITGDVAEQVEY